MATNWRRRRVSESLSKKKKTVSHLQSQSGVHVSGDHADVVSVAKISKGKKKAAAKTRVYREASSDVTANFVPERRDTSAIRNNIAEADAALQSLTREINGLEVHTEGEARFPVRPNWNTQGGMKRAYAQVQKEVIVDIPTEPKVAKVDKKNKIKCSPGELGDVVVEMTPIKTEAQEKGEAIERQRRVDLKIAIRKTIADFTAMTAKRLTELSVKVEEQLKSVVTAISEVAVAKKDFDIQLADLEDTLKVVCGLQEDIDPVELGITDEADDNSISEMFRVDDNTDMNDIDFTPPSPEPKVTKAVEGVLLSEDEDEKPASADEYFN
jgi:hypothetical protein